LANSIGTFFEADPQEAHYGDEFRNAVSEIGDAVREYSDHQKELSTKVQEFLAKLMGIKPKVTERDNLQLDYDKWRNAVKQSQDKPKEAIKLQQAEQKYENYKEIFETSNYTLIQEISDLYNNRFEEFDSAYKTLIVSQYKLFTRISTAFAGVKSSDTVSIKSSSRASVNRISKPPSSQMSLLDALTPEVKDPEIKPKVQNKPSLPKKQVAPKNQVKKNESII